jgi:hypothetical protein
VFDSIKIDKKYIDILQEKIKEDPIHTASGTLWIMDKDFCKQFDFINSDAFVDCSNIFKINNSYKPHTDVFMPEVQTNVLIPLAKENDEDLSMVLFDQSIQDRGTWVWDSVKDISKYPPKTHLTRPCETEGVEGLTGNPVEENLKPYLPYGEEYFHGLSGKVMPWEIGSAYAFSARQIHCSGKQSGWKIGASFRLSCPWNEALYLI